MLSEKSLTLLLAELMPKELPSFLFESNCEAGPWNISLIGKVETPNSILQRAFVQVETEPNFVKENIEAHVEIKNSIAKAGELKGRDTYWIIYAGELDLSVIELAKDNKIEIRDRKWLLKMIDSHKNDSKIKYIIQTLQTANSWNP